MQIGSSTSIPYAGNVEAPVRRDADADAASQDTSSETATTTPEPAVSSIRQFASGALGLDSPGTPSDDANEFYTAGKWVAAAVTVGKIISLFV
ncbi:MULTISPECIES: hypothetical protein [unclassified Caballeronia]|uniref:hypothetical protein n=1 Tax=unclassified Caballeronia TaxID=2646786 RepID=UPI002861A6B2|nr:MULTISPECIES: hypothetical protein [unclassified Caballeronia]MDR5740515.1 hypothetical protein [Caballeronia sp. LZ016]MDR5808965.1 hypothetical protein [Caballeronia sp. LZ019]